jgi:hypothetical protein
MVPDSRETVCQTLNFPTETAINPQKGLLDCRVAVCCALKNNGPFFELDHPNLGGTCKFEGNPHEKNMSGHERK